MTTLTILDQPIRRRNGLFSLNDLHRASGENETHRPSKFMRTKQTHELIEEIEKELSPNMGLAFKSLKGGANPGTWVCKELVYAYAMWISAKFHLKVIRAFDALVNQRIKRKQSGDFINMYFSFVPVEYKEVAFREPRAAKDLVFVTPTDEATKKRTGHNIDWWNPPKVGDGHYEINRVSGLLCAMDLVKLARNNPDEAKKALKYAILYCGNSLQAHNNLEAGTQSMYAEKDEFASVIARGFIEQLIYQREQTGKAHVYGSDVTHTIEDEQ